MDMCNCSRNFTIKLCVFLQRLNGCAIHFMMVIEAWKKANNSSKDKMLPLEKAVKYETYLKHLLC